VACGLCVEACPQVGGNEFDVGLKARKAIYRPFPQSVPSTYVVDQESCLNFMRHLTEKQRTRLKKVERLKRKKQPDYPPNILVCGHCEEACDVNAIDFDMLAEDVELRVGSVVVAVGFQDSDGALEGLVEEVAHGTVHLPSGLLGEVAPRGGVLAGHLKKRRALAFE